jgi:hypothetical protein
VLDAPTPPVTVADAPAGTGAATSPGATTRRALVPDLAPVGHRGFWAVVVIGFVAVGALERWWVVSNPLGALTSDGAVTGIMALHLLHHGQLPAYMWGQAYGGNLEMALTAGVFAVFGVGTTQLLATGALSSAVAAVAVWRAGRWIVGEPAARLGALALWVWPPLYTWRSLKPGGTYLVGLTLAWCAVGLVARLKRGDERTGLLVALGVLCGLALWSSPMSLQLLVPAAIGCRAPLRALGRRLFWVVAGGVAGGVPVLFFAATHRATNLWYPGQRSFLGAMPGRFAQFFWWEWPIALGGRFEGSFGWVLGPLGVLVVVAGTVGVVLAGRAVLRGRAERCRLPVLTLACLPFLFAFNSLANHVGQGRYVLFGATMGTLLVGVGLEDLGRRVASRTGRDGARHDLVSWVFPTGLGVLALLGTLALVREPPLLLSEFEAAGAHVPADDTALRTLVAQHHVHDAFASYWLAYRLTFETEEHTLATPFTFERYPPIFDAVAASPHPAYLFLSASPTFGRFERWCTAHHVAFRAATDGAFAVVLPARRVLPLSVPHDVLGAR